MPPQPSTLITKSSDFRPSGDVGKHTLGIGGLDLMIPAYWRCCAVDVIALFSQDHQHGTHGHSHQIGVRNASIGFSGNLLTTLYEIHWASEETYYMYTLLEAVRHFRSFVMDDGSRGTTAHAHRCCRFQGYPKAVPSRMKLTMREPASMATDNGSRRVTSYSNSVFRATLTESHCNKKIK